MKASARLVSRIFVSMAVVASGLVGTTTPTYASKVMHRAAERATSRLDNEADSASIATKHAVAVTATARHAPAADFICDVYCADCSGGPGGFWGGITYPFDFLAGYGDPYTDDLGFTDCSWPHDYPGDCAHPDCTGGENLATPATIDSLWDAAEHGSTAQLAQMLSFRGVQLNDNRHAIQAKICGGIAASIPLTDDQYADVRAALAAAAQSR